MYPVTRPYRIEVGAAGAGQAHALMLHFPPALLPLPPSQLERLTAVAMPASAGIGALTARFLAQLAAGIDQYSPVEGRGWPPPRWRCWPPAWPTSWTASAG